MKKGLVYGLIGLGIGVTGYSIYYIVRKIKIDSGNHYESILKFKKLFYNNNNCNHK